MKCKYCDQELVEGKRFCPSCGKENEIEETVQEAPAEEAAAQEVAVEETSAEETSAEEIPAEQPSEIKEGAKMTSGKLAVAIVAGIVVVAILIALIVSGMGGKTAETADPTEPSETEMMGTIPPDGNPDDVTCKGSYTVTDEEAIAAADTIVATMDGAELTNAELQVFYWMEAINLLNSGYAAYFDVDFTQPLDTQLFEEGMTWQQYFLSCALDSWRTYQGLMLEAEEAGHVLQEDFAGYLETLHDDLESGAVASGLADAQELVQYNVGAGADLDDYTKYIEMYYTGYSYFNELYSQIDATTEEIEAYFAENEEMYAEYGITKDGGDQMNVRHILIMVEGGTTDDTGVTTYSDEEWAACEAEAQAILDEWLAGEATEDSFAQLAIERSEDGGSSSNGGLYEGLTADTNFVENFKNWYLEEGRQAGDYGLVRTEYGYHVMYFSGTEPIWSATAEADLLNERANSILPDCVERHPATVDYSAIKLGLSRLGEAEE